MSEDSRERKLLGREEEEGGGRGSWRQLTSFSSWKMPATATITVKKQNIHEFFIL
jgi:hypothetical protein